MDWQMMIELAFVAALAIGMIAYATGRVRSVEAAASTAVKKAAADAAARAGRETGGEWRRRYRNLEVLRDLQVAFAGLPATIFGSSLENGFFRAPRLGSDVDLMVEVDEDTFVAWAAQVYGGQPVGSYDDLGVLNPNDWDEPPIVRVRGREWAVAPYAAAYPTRIARREAAEEILGLTLGGELSPSLYDHEGVKLDIFLFPNSFVRGEMAIPAWDGTAAETEGRSFRDEVLAGTKLADLKPAE